MRQRLQSLLADTISINYQIEHWKLVIRGLISFNLLPLLFLRQSNMINFQEEVHYSQASSCKLLITYRANNLWLYFPCKLATFNLLIGLLSTLPTQVNWKSFIRLEMSKNITHFLLLNLLYLQKLMRSTFICKMCVFIIYKQICPTSDYLLYQLHSIVSWDYLVYLLVLT